jgi:hypothetical protein
MKYPDLSKLLALVQEDRTVDRAGELKLTHERVRSIFDSGRSSITWVVKSMRSLGLTYIENLAKV